MVSVDTSPFSRGAGAAPYAGVVSHVDRDKWNDRYEHSDPAPVLDPPPPPPLFAEVVDLFPLSGSALELACGRGRGAVWLASRGMSYLGVDVSPIALDLAIDLAARSGLTRQCRFEVFDLDRGLPPGDAVDLVMSYLFFDRRLVRPMIDRVKAGGMLAIATLSEVGAEPGEFRAKPGELASRFDTLDVMAGQEADGYAWLIGGKGRTPLR